MIIGRNAEIELLNKMLHDDKSHFVAVYGRRRIGKTYLIALFCVCKCILYPGTKVVVNACRP